MPNPKTGTVTFDVGKAVREIKAGKVEYRVDKTAIIHAPIGKVSFGADKLLDNARALIDSVMKAKPPAAKGQVRQVHRAVVHHGPRGEGRPRLRGSPRRRGTIMNRTEKQTLIDDLHKEFGKSPHAILVDFRGPQRARGHGVPPQGAAGRLAVPRGEEHPGPARGEGHAAREAGAEVRQHDGRGLHRHRPRGPGQDARSTSPRTTRSWWSRAGWSPAPRCSTRRG